MRNIKKIFLFVFVVVFSVMYLSSIETEAKEVSIPTPSIKAKLINGKTGIKITISKTKDAEWYEVYLACEATDLYDGFRRDWYAPGSGDMIRFGKDNFIPYLKVQSDGSQARTVILENLAPGKYYVKVQAYNRSKFGMEVRSGYSNTVSVTTKFKEGRGYETSYNFSKVKKGDTILFGSYEQDGILKNGFEPIEWIVLSKTKKQMILLSKYELDRMPFVIGGNENDKNATWETCSLRRWLNSKFYKAAFNTTEKELIKETKVDNKDTELFKTSSGKDTKDRVFLLSASDMIVEKYGFDKNCGTHDQNRVAPNTRYAYGANHWWLRTHGYFPSNAMYVAYDGVVNTNGWNMTYGLAGDSNLAVRPVIVIDLTVDINRKK